MTKTELRQAMLEHGETVNDLAAAIPYSARTIESWRSGARQIPPPAALILEFHYRSLHWAREES